MISEDLKGLGVVLGRLLGRVDPECAEILRNVRRNLDALSSDVENMEANFIPCPTGTKQEA